MTTENLRYIDIPDTNVRVGFNFYPNYQFYVTNQETTTYRNTVEDIIDVLKALEISLGTHDITPDTIQALKDNLETLNKVYYTWDTTGSFIHSIQFNDWQNYPIVIDCYKQKLYIKNSTTIFDLTTNESAEVVRVPLLLSYYKETLGLTIPKVIMQAIYNNLISYYNPILINTNLYHDFYNSHKCTNQLVGRSEEDIQKNTPLMYGNVFKVSDFANNTPIVYTCTQDPYNTPIPTFLSNISSLSNNSIITTETIETSSKKVIVSGCSIEADENNYSADGEYTVQGIEDTTVTVEETLPITYTFPYFKLFALGTTYIIEEISRENNTITVTNAPNDILAGESIIITDADIPTTLETIKINGRYTVESITGNTITVTEPILTNHTYTGEAKLTKEIYVTNIENIDSNGTVLTLSEPYNLESNDIIVYNSNIDFSTKQENTIQSISGNTITVDTRIDNFPIYPELLYPAPDPSIEISIEHTKYEDVMPEGAFIVNNFTEVVRYLSIPKDKQEKPIAFLPTDETDTFGNKSIKDNMYNVVPTSMTIPVEIRGEEDTTLTMYCKGIYSEIYKDEE